jgi:flagellar basal-body rod modification protein FlgD
MTFPLAGLGASPPAPVRDRRDLGRDQFLELLVTQLRHQDPLSPLAPDQFAAQLAQFTSVEQLTKLNDAFALQQEQSAAKGLLEKTALGASLIGRQVVVQGDFLTVAQDGSTTFRAAIGGSGGSATLKLLDPSGQVIATQQLGMAGGGMQTIRPPAGLPPGTYRYALDVKDASGDPVPVIPYTQGQVTGVIFENGTVMLKIGSIRIPLDQLSEITP